MRDADDPTASVFFDSNVLLYLASDDDPRADRAELLLESGGTVSVQVLNEFAEVARRKFKMEWPEVREMLFTICETCTVRPVSLETHERGIELAERYRMGVYDGMIIAAALEAGCTTLFSEDMQHGQRIERLTIRNPFASSGF